VTFIDRLAIRTKLVLLAGVPVVGALVLAAMIAVQASRQVALAAALGSIDDVAELSVHISGVLHALQRERAGLALSAGLEARPEPVETRKRPAVERNAADAALAQLDQFLAGRDLSRLPPRLARDLAVARAQVAGRDAFLERASYTRATIAEILASYGSADDALVSSMAALTGLSDDGELLRSIASLVALSQLSERASREHALLSFVFATGSFPPGAFKTLVTLSTEQDVYEDAFKASAGLKETRQYQEALASEGVARARSLRDKALQTIEDDFDVDPQAWFDAEGDRLSKLQEIESDLLMRITYAAASKMEASRASVRFGLGLSASIVIASVLIALIITRGVTRAIFSLTRVAATVRETKDFSIRAKKTSADELGTLTDTFNEMLSTIEERDAFLEAQVNQRTEELRRTVGELWSEMDLARKIQTVLLPQNPNLPSYEVSATMIPASAVCGDYYDIVQTKGADWIFVGDVSGHGVTAGLTMMIVQTAVRTVVQSPCRSGQELNPKDVLIQVNSVVHSSLQKISADQYMTIMALRLQGGTVTYSGLHQDVIVYRAASGKAERIEARGAWVGLADDISGLMDDDVFEMQRGDVLLLCTDGVTEAKIGDELLGTDGLASLLEKIAGAASDPDTVVKGVLAQLSGSTLTDDVTLLAARYMGDASERRFASTGPPVPVVA
jgi:serine phosphatase RsbU (regulator of sigma subunit)